MLCFPLFAKQLLKAFVTSKVHCCHTHCTKEGRKLTVLNRLMFTFFTTFLPRCYYFVDVDVLVSLNLRLDLLVETFEGLPSSRIRYDVKQ